MTSDEISAGVSSLVYARQELMDRAVSRAIEKAVAAERRRCAGIAKECFERDYPHQDPSYVEGCKEAAEVILERIRSGE